MFSAAPFPKCLSALLPPINLPPQLQSALNVLFVLSVVLNLNLEPLRMFSAKMYQGGFAGFYNQ